MVANSACLLGCRTMLYRLDIKSLILLLISVARSMLNTAEGGYPIQLDSNSSQSRAANMAEGGEASSGRHIHREGLGSPQVPTHRPSPSLGIHIWNHCVSSSNSGGRGKLSTQILTPTTLLLTDLLLPKRSVACMLIQEECNGRTSLKIVASVKTCCDQAFRTNNNISASSSSPFFFFSPVSTKNFPFNAIETCR